MSATLVLQPDATAGIDTYLSEFGDPGNESVKNYGITTTMAVGRGNAVNYGLLQFDLSSLPSNIHIVSATVKLHCSSVLSSSVSETVSFYRALLAWFEGSQNGVAPTAGQDGSTYKLRNANGSVAWGGGSPLSGTDFDAVALTSTSLSTTGDYNFDLTTFVQNVVDGVYTNLGWHLRGLNATNSEKFFSSSDSATAANRPQITIVYQFKVTSTLSATDDTMIQEAHTTFNYGTTTTLGVGNDAANLRLRSLIKFDVSAIPANATIFSAKLRLYCTSELDTTDRNVSAYRSLVQWYEDGQNGAAPGAGVDGSTYTNRNANGSVAWTSGAGGGSAGNGVETVASPTATVSITGTGIYFEWDVSTDVSGFVAGTFTNFGWWMIGIALTSAEKIFGSRENATSGFRPQLVVQYTYPMAPAVAGTSTVSGHLTAVGRLAGLAIGQTTVQGHAFTNAAQGSAQGSSTVTGRLGAGSHLLGPAAGQATVTGRLKGIISLRGTSAGTSTATANGDFEGEMRGQIAGVSSAIATGHTYARHVAPIRGCEILPLFYITDGTIRDNGQINWLNLIDDRIGFVLDDWKPNIAQYKDGGTFSDSPYGTGRRLVKRVFANAIEVLSMKCRGHDFDDLAWYTRQFFHFQEAAADFWSANWVDRPIYIVAKAPQETNIRYAIVHVMSCPELENPYAQAVNPATGKPALESFMMRIERGDWLSNPPRDSECVAVSSQRSWTIASWT